MVAAALRRRWSLDGCIAVAFAVAAAAEGVVRSHGTADLLLELAGAPLLLLLAVRRSRPLLMISVFCAGLTAGSLLQAWLTPQRSSDAFVPIFALLFAVYSVAAHGSRRAVAAAAPLPLLALLAVDTTRPHSNSLASAVLFFSVFIVAAPIVGGRLVRGRSLLIVRLEGQARELAEQRAADVAAALAGERLRVTRELHQDLTEGMQRLVDELPASATDGSAADAAQVEKLVRRLLAATREAVVSLSDGAAPQAPAPIARRAVPRPSSDAAQPWTALAAAALTAGLLVETRALPLHVPAPTAAVACVLVSLPLAFAWARPLPMVAALWVCAAVFTHGVAPLEHTTSAIGLVFVPPFVVGALEYRTRAVVGLAVCWGGALAVFGAGALPGDAALATACWLAGVAFQQRSRLVDELHANNVLLEQGRAVLAARAVNDERMRIARELHDAVGHSLTVVALQAGAARRIWTSDRGKAEQMLDTVRTVAVAGLAELRSGLTAVTDLHDASLDELVDGARRAGLVVDATSDESLVTLTPQQFSTLYRIVQESLTNVLKHSPGAAVTITVQRVGDHVEVTIDNTPPTSAPAAQQPGQGLRGMRRRVEECGGTLRHGPAADGGFTVSARLPVAMVPA